MANKILVIDDEKNIGELIQLAMQAKGHKVEYATTGGEGIALFNRLAPDLVLIDKRLPDMDGIEVARRIRQADAGKKTPLLLMTGEVSGQGLDKTLFVAAIDKPISMAQLTAIIESMLKPQSH
jgi:DNA-binding response OmpR family regulator